MERDTPWPSPPYDFPASDTIFFFDSNGPVHRSPKTPPTHWLEWRLPMIQVIDGKMVVEFKMGARTTG